MNEFALLKACGWQPPAKISRALAELGVTHGFFGRGDTPPESHHTRQVHGTRLVLAEALATGPGATRRVEADAVYTRTPGTTISIRTADCLPVILVDTSRRAAVAVHAGWRGLTSGILGETVATLEGQGIRPADWTAVIGPAIARESYEVGVEVIEALESGGIDLSPAQVAIATAKGKDDRWQLDTVVAGVFALCNAGLRPEKITVIQADTFRLTEWHSYRREGKGVPMNWSWVTL